MDKGLQIRLMVGIIITIIIIWILTKVFKRVGIIKSDEALKTEQQVEALNNLEYFNPNLYNGKIFKQLSDNQAKAAVVQIISAMQGLGTDESAIYAVFKRLDNKMQISQLANTFYKGTSADLLTELKSELRESELAQLYKIIEQLPNR